MLAILFETFGSLVRPALVFVAIWHRRGGEVGVAALIADAAVVETLGSDTFHR